MYQLVRDILLRFPPSPTNSICGAKANSNILHTHPNSPNMGATGVVHKPIATISSAIREIVSLATSTIGAK